MLKKFKKKSLFIYMLPLFLCSLSSCGYESVHDKQGYTQKVIYDLGEGIFDPSKRNTHTLEFYYQPGSYITNFEGVLGYTFVRESEDGVNYEMDGWYFDKEFTQPVNFDEYTLPNDSNIVTTIYAKWNAIYETFFNIYYLNEQTNEMELLQSLSYERNKPFVFDTQSIFYPSEETYTYIESYMDEQMTQVVDSSYVLTSQNQNLPIYTKWIKGNFKVVNTAKELKNYFSRFAATHDLYINSDIDASQDNFSSVYLSSLSNKQILGNNHKITNWTHSTRNGENGSKTTITVGGFVDTLEDCVIKDLIFEDAIFTIEANTCKYVNFGGLAGKIVNSTIENVSVSGKVMYTQGTLDRLNSTNETTKLNDIRIANSSICYSEETSTITDCFVNLIDTRS